MQRVTSPLRPPVAPRSRGVWRVLTALACLAAVVGAGGGLWLYASPAFAVDGHPVPARQDDVPAWLTALAARRAAEPMAVGAGGAWRGAPLRELGVEVDVRATAAALAEARALTLRQRWALRNQTVEVALRFRVQGASFSATLGDLAPRVRQEPVPARLDLENHTRIDDVPGRQLDPQGTLAAVVDAATHHRVLAPVATRELRAAITASDLAAVDVSKTMSAYETTFATWGTGFGRSANIRAAARWLDGTLIAPGATISFNDVVGARTLKRGFTFAPEIVGDELETGIGGGTCQVASTLHAAALYGALDVVERHAHGRASSYTQMGMDATVAYGAVDLRIRNPFDFPVVVHAYLPKPTQIRVELLGAEPQATVGYVYSSRKTDDFFRRITYKPSLPAGTTTRHQKGSPGFMVYSYVTTKFTDGRVTKRSYASEYHPVPEVYWVGPGASETALPEPGEGVLRTERRGLPEEPPKDPTGPAS